MYISLKGMLHKVLTEAYNIITINLCLLKFILRVKKSYFRRKNKSRGKPLKASKCLIG